MVAIPKSKIVSLLRYIVKGQHYPMLKCNPIKTIQNEGTFQYLRNGPQPCLPVSPNNLQLAYSLLPVLKPILPNACYRDGKCSLP